MDFIDNLDGSRVDVSELEGEWLNQVIKDYVDYRQQFHPHEITCNHWECTLFYNDAKIFVKGAQVFVDDPAQYGTFGPSWIRRFYGIEA